MFVSLNWLKEFVEIDCSVSEAAEILTMGGIEVESVSHEGRGLDQVVTAKIIDIAPHPQSKKLSLARIDLGSGQVTVVCGAPNIRVGQVVPYARIGVTLPAGIEIQPRTIRGVESPGMICSEKELGLGDDESGILVLADDIQIGLPLTTALPFAEDFVLEVVVTPNRGDCLSILGVARELAALMGKPWRVPEFSLVEGDASINDTFRIEVPDADLCPRYVARMVEGVKIGPSPLDIRIRLARSGLRPISNVVDATNLILMECGQPLHAFDCDLLLDRRIVVKRSAPGETFVTLDGTERTLPENSLMIRDGQRSVALAGIMGGLNSEIGENTCSVLIESACFERFGIRRTAKALGMSTEASFRFERGVDPDGTYWAAHRAASLIQAVAGGTALRGCIDIYGAPVSRSCVSVRTNKVNALLGTDLDTNQVASNLRRLGITVTASLDNGETLECSAPSWRWDLDREVDMIEEVARIHGYQNIPASMPTCISGPDRTQENRGQLKKVHECMNAAGFSEIITMSFTSREAVRAFATSDEACNLELLNPLTEEYAVMRTSLLPGLLAATRRNINYKCENLKLYEMGRVFTVVPGQELPREDLKLAAIAVGKRHPDLWHYLRGEVDICGKIDSSLEVDFYDLRGTLETLVERFYVSEVEFVASKIPFLHPGKAADVFIGGDAIGFVGELDPKKASAFDLKAQVQIFEIFLEPLFVQTCKKRSFRPIPRYPYIERDLSLMVETNCSGDQIKHLISRLGHDIIASVALLDLYRGESIPEGSQSMAFRIRYQSEDRTLTDEEVQAVHSSVAETLAREVGASLRE